MFVVSVTADWVERAYQELALRHGHFLPVFVLGHAACTGQMLFFSTNFLFVFRSTHRMMKPYPPRQADPTFRYRVFQSQLVAVDLQQRGPVRHRVLYLLPQVVSRAPYFVE